MEYTGRCVSISKPDAPNLVDTQYRKYGGTPEVRQLARDVIRWECRPYPSMQPPPLAYVLKITSASAVSLPLFVWEVRPRMVIIIDSPQLCWRWIYTIGCYYYYYYYYAFFFLLLFFCLRYQLILGQTHDEMENGKLVTHICETFRSSSPIDQYPITW